MPLQCSGRTLLTQAPRNKAEFLHFKTAWQFDFRRLYLGQAESFITGGAVKVQMRVGVMIFRAIVLAHGILGDRTVINAVYQSFFLESFQRPVKCDPV